MIRDKNGVEKDRDKTKPKDFHRIIYNKTCVYLKQIVFEEKMGSLMAGWKSKSGMYKRNHSLTNDEIEAFWRSHKKADQNEQHIIDGDTIICEEKTATVNKSSKRFEKSSSMPLARTKLEKDQKFFMHGETETMSSTADKLVDNNGWWTRSSWAFLNEPPVCEGAPNSSKRYASQFHVASSTGGGDGIISA